MSTFSTTDAQTPEGLLQVGRVTRPHGVRGDVYVAFFTDRPERTRAGARLWLQNNWLTVTSARRQPNSWLMHFAGIDDRNAAERISKSDLYGEPIEDQSVMWVHELIGVQVEDLSGKNYGRCVAVIDNPAHALLELESGALVPIVFVVSRTNERITINPPAGLFNLNTDTDLATDEGEK